MRSRLLTGEKVSDHRRLAAALSSIGTADPAEIALHWREGAEPAHELTWRVQAAQHARRRLDPVQEAEHWLRVVELWPSEDAPAEIEGCADRDDALFNAIEACEWSDEWSVRALALADARLIELRGVATDSSARFHELMARVHAQRPPAAHQDDRTVALELAQQSVELSRQLPVGSGLARALQTCGWLLGEDGKEQEGLALVREALEVAQVIDDPVMIYDITVALAAREAYSGDLESAMTRIDALRAGGPAPSWQLEMFLGMIHTDILLVYCRPLAEVEEAGRASVDLSRTPGLTGSGVIVKINIAEAMIRAGQVSRAAALLVPPEEAGTLLSNFLLSTWSRLELCRGRLAEARRLIAELRRRRRKPVAAGARGLACRGGRTTGALERPAGFSLASPAHGARGVARHQRDREPCPGVRPRRARGSRLLGRATESVTSSLLSRTSADARRWTRSAVRAETTTAGGPHGMPS